MKKKIAFTLVAIIVLLAMWTFYPTQIPAVTHVIGELPPSEHEKIKKKMHDFAEENSVHGISEASDPGPVGFMELKCKSVPILSLSRVGKITLLQTAVDAKKFSPDIAQLVNSIFMQKDPAWPHSENVTQSKEFLSADSIDRLVLKYRDGIDLNVRCYNPEGP
jgi:hypothetical protein